jgi:hypothetical protein
MNDPKKKRHRRNNCREQEPRDAFGWRMPDTLRRDGRHAIRRLAKDWQFSAGAIGILALGIGANTAVFSILNNSLFQPEIVEEWKWMGTPVWSHAGIVCTGETYKNVVKMTFPKGAALKDPSGLFNSSLGGNVRHAIDIHEGDKVDEAALKDLIRAAVALNLKGKTKPEPRRASSKRAD